MPTQNTRTSEPFEVALGITSFGLRGAALPEQDLLENERLQAEREQRWS